MAPYDTPIMRTEAGPYATVTPATVDAALIIYENNFLPVPAFDETEIPFEAIRLQLGGGLELDPLTGRMLITGAGTFHFMGQVSTSVPDSSYMLATLYTGATVIGETLVAVPLDTGIGPRFQVAGMWSFEPVAGADPPNVFMTLYTNSASVSVIAANLQAFRVGGPSILTADVV